MDNTPVPVAVSVLRSNGKTLLIKRAGGDYAGLWALPGGKIEKNEHISEAAVREVLEETGIRAEFKGMLGTVSEHLIENNRISRHFLLHICELALPAKQTSSCHESDLRWLGMKALEGMKEQIIPSDFLIIERMVRSREKPYYNCVLEKTGNKYVLRKFG